MNDLFALLGLQPWKPYFTALLLPPVPFLLLLLVGARLMFWRRGLAWLLMLLAGAAIYLSCCTAVGGGLQRHLLEVPPAISPERIAELRKAGTGKVAIVALGGGRESLAPEYGVANLSPNSLARLAYALHLSRQLNAPVMFSGGIGHGATPGAPEAEVAARVAERDFGRPLKWVETESRDTRENASLSLPILQAAGVTEVVLVSNGWHLPRALRAFHLEAQRSGFAGHVQAAPMGLAAGADDSAPGWLPSAEGFALVRMVLRERFGQWFGA